MGTDSMILLPAPLDKYDTRAHPIHSWVPMGIEVSLQENLHIPTKVYSNEQKIRRYRNYLPTEL